MARAVVHSCKICGYFLDPIEEDHYRNTFSITICDECAEVAKLAFDAKHGGVRDDEHEGVVIERIDERRKTSKVAL